jgi:hypothetical protein
MFLQFCKQSEARAWRKTALATASVQTTRAFLNWRRQRAFEIRISSDESRRRRQRGGSDGRAASRWPTAMRNDGLGCVTDSERVGSGRGASRSRRARRRADTSRAAGTGPSARNAHGSSRNRPNSTGDGYWMYFQRKTAHVAVSRSNMIAGVLGEDVPVLETETNVVDRWPKGSEMEGTR